jgi:RimJ/RimL family protein N-acetyltransferase
MALTLSDVAKMPEILTSEIILPMAEVVVFRPLVSEDASQLAQFLKNLSVKTREYYQLDSYDLTMAQEMCDAINRYDKLRLVVVLKDTQHIIAIFEYSFDIPESDTERYASHGIRLVQGSDCRIGPCVSDVFQDRKVGSAIFPLLIDIARQFGQKRMILWGGVCANNMRAIAFYEKNGFRRVGMSTINGKETWDMMMNVERVD